MRFVRIARIHKCHQNRAEFFEIHRFRHVRVETRLDTFFIHIPQDVGREGDDGEVGSLVVPLPLSNLLAGLIAVFIRHVEVAQND